MVGNWVLVCVVCWGCAVVWSVVVVGLGAGVLLDVARARRRWAGGAGGRWLGAGVLPDNAEAAGAVEVEGGDSQVEPQVGLVETAPGDFFGAGFDLRDFAFGLGA